MSNLAVTLTIEQLRDLVSVAVRDELARMPLTAPPEVLTLEECAELLRRHPKIVMKLVRDEELPAHYISEREPRFRRSEVLAWLDRRPREPKPNEAA